MEVILKNLTEISCSALGRQTSKNLDKKNGMVIFCKTSLGEFISLDCRKAGKIISEDSGIQLCLLIAVYHINNEELTIPLWFLINSKTIDERKQEYAGTINKICIDQFNMTVKEFYECNV